MYSPPVWSTSPGCDGETCEPDALVECVNFYTYEFCEEGCLVPGYCAEFEFCHPDVNDNGAGCLENDDCGLIMDLYLEFYNPPEYPDNKCYSDDDCTVLNLGCNVGIVECHAANHTAAFEAEELMLGWEASGCFLGECPACDEKQVTCEKEMPDNPEAEGICVII